MHRRADWQCRQVSKEDGAIHLELDQDLHSYQKQPPTTMIRYQRGRFVVPDVQKNHIFTDINFFKVYFKIRPAFLKAYRRRHLSLAHTNSLKVKSR